MRIDSTIAAVLSRPRLMHSKTVVTMWIESAMAMTMTIIGTPALVGLNTTPFQPANPRVVVMTNTSMATMATVPRSERRRMIVAPVMMTNTTGVRVCMSSRVASAKVRC